MNEEDRLEEESERLQKEYEKRRSERLRGGATDEQINQAYKERQILDQQDPRTDEEFLKKRAEEGPDAGEVAKGVGFEIAAGLATDIATKPLLALPPLYALANFVSGAAANLIAQKLRGETKLSLGEILGSGAVGIIPGSQIKTGKTLSKIVGEAASGQRVLVSGAAQGIGGEAIRIGIDEQRLLTAKEAAFAGGTGGLVSRGFMEILNARKPALDYINRVLTKNVGPTGAPAADVFAAGSVGAAKVNPNNLNPPKVTAGGDIVEVSVDGKLKQYALFDRRNYTKYETLGEELVERSFGVIPDPSSPNYRQFQKFNQQVFRPLMERIGGENSFYSVLAENENFSYIEHLIAKGQHMDWFWELKGADRNASENVRLLLNDPYKKLKDIVENYGYGTVSNGYSGPFLESTDLTKRLIVDVEGLPVASGEGIPVVAQNSPGNIVIREAGTSTKPGRVVGKIGDYMDLLFREEDKIIDGLQNMKIIPRKKYVKS